MKQPRDFAEYLSLGQAAKIAPGRPTTNCLWRWCRKGVLARNGERVRLEHIRIGRDIYTSRRWLAEFGAKLAQADAAHFDKAPQPSPAGAVTSPREAGRRAELLRIDQELADAGL